MPDEKKASANIPQSGVIDNGDDFFAVSNVNGIPTKLEPDVAESAKCSACGKGSMFAFTNEEVQGANGPTYQSGEQCDNEKCGHRENVKASLGPKK